MSILISKYALYFKIYKKWLTENKKRPAYVANAIVFTCFFTTLFLHEYSENYLHIFSIFIVATIIIFLPFWFTTIFSVFGENKSK
jgi:hypothetical protein